MICVSCSLAGVFVYYSLRWGERLLFFAWMEISKGGMNIANDVMPVRLNGLDAATYVDNRGTISGSNILSISIKECYFLVSSLI